MGTTINLYGNQRPGNCKNIVNNLNTAKNKKTERNLLYTHIYMSVCVYGLVYKRNRGSVKVAVLLKGRIDELDISVE